MKAGPKAAVDDSALPFRTKTVGSKRFSTWCAKFITVPKGAGALGPLKLRDWQVDLVGSVLDAPVRPRTAGWMLPRGQGKSSLLAAWGLYEMFEGGEGATVVVVAVDERQAGIIFSIARRMCELNEDLASRVQTFKTKLVIPGRDASFECLPAEAKRLEGLDYSLAFLDEAGVVARDSYETLVLAQGKRAVSSLICIGTPGPNLADQVLLDLRTYGMDHRDDPTFVWREFSAQGYEDHAPDCPHCWSLANPALDDFLHRDALVALQPPKTRESAFRRARLCQFVAETAGAFLPVGIWDALGTGAGIPDRAEVVVAFDGSFSDDTTALLVATVSQRPHLDTLRVWDPHGVEGYRVPIAEVEAEIRKACKRWKVVEVIADPHRWARSLQVLQSERLPVVEFPHTPSRLTEATSALYTACINNELTHSGDDTLAAHIGASIVIDDPRGMRLAKSSRSRHAGKIDLAACAVMAYSRAVWRATHRPKRRGRGFP